MGADKNVYTNPLDFKITFFLFFCFFMNNKNTFLALRYSSE
jgi:hypothetical protein